MELNSTVSYGSGSLQSVVGLRSCGGTYGPQKVGHGVAESDEDASGSLAIDL